jgi:hypothetical protein
MPTPSQIAKAKRAESEDQYFVVHEVVECVSEGEEGYGEEDLPEELRSPTKSLSSTRLPALRITQVITCCQILNS